MPTSLANNLPKRVKIVEVGPRDGLQNEKQPVSTQVKLAFIQQLAGSGLRAIEATSFVSPKRVPQMADHERIMRTVMSDPAFAVQAGVQYSALTPNLQGLENAMACGATEVAVFAAASETFSQKNTNCSIEVALSRFSDIVARAKRDNIAVRGYVSCVMGCPYEGEIAPTVVAEVAQRLFDMGCYEIALGDTIGAGTVLQTQALIEQVSQRVPVKHLAVHFHDTCAQALVNIYAAMMQGVAVIDASTAGLGGCPYAPGASGNVATEDVLYMLSGLNIETGVDLASVVAAGNALCQQLKVPNRSRVARKMLAHPGICD